MEVAPHEEAPIELNQGLDPGIEHEVVADSYLGELRIDICYKDIEES